MSKKNVGQQEIHFNGNESLHLAKLLITSKRELEEIIDVVITFYNVLFWTVATNYPVA